MNTAAEMMPSEDGARLRRAVKSGRLDLACLSSLSEAGINSIPPIHELCERGHIVLPNAPSPEPPHPDLEGRLVKLRLAAERREYNEMVRGVAAGSPLAGGEGDKQVETDSFAHDMQTVNRQLTTILNMGLTVIGAFFFGYKASEFLMVEGDTNHAYQYLCGSLFATIVFFADLYFVAKTLAQ